MVEYNLDQPEEMFEAANERRLKYLQEKFIKNEGFGILLLDLSDQDMVETIRIYALVRKTFKKAGFSYIPLRISFVGGLVQYAFMFINSVADKKELFGLLQQTSKDYNSLGFLYKEVCQTVCPIKIYQNNGQMTIWGWENLKELLKSSNCWEYFMKDKQKHKFHKVSFKNQPKNPLEILMREKDGELF